MCVYNHIYIYIQIYMCFSKNRSLDIYIYIHTHIQTYTHTHIHTYTHTDIHTYIHTHIHTYIHACILTYLLTLISLNPKKQGTKARPWWNHAQLKFGKWQCPSIHQFPMNNWLKNHGLWISYPYDWPGSCMCYLHCIYIIYIHIYIHTYLVLIG